MYKLLVVDDERSTRMTLCDCFPWSEVGFTIVQQANNGLNALKYLQQHHVDAVLSDIRMPIMSGLDLLKKMKQLQLTSHFIIMSGYRDFDYAQKAIEYGVRRFIIKPLKFEELYTTFATLSKELSQHHETSTQKKPTQCDINYTEDFIYKVIQYITINYQEANLEEAAKIIHMNPSYLSHVFKKQTGINFSHYINKVRMEKAANLIKQNNFSIWEISEMVGYTNAKNFTRSFKKFHGSTPREYRRKN